MTPVLVDANVLIDIATNDPVWGEWSSAHARIETLEALLPEDVFHREPLPWPAAFLAGKAYLAYRRRGGARRSPLPDFYIGAHAAIRGYRLLSRDRGRYATYFPTLQIIAPD